MNEQYQASGQPQKPAAAKWLWITLIIVVLLGGAFAAWYFLAGPGKTVASSTTTTTTTPVDETADWLTYTDSVNGFSFKYPKTWFTDISATDQTVLVSNYQKASKYDKSTAPADLLIVGAMEYKTAVQTADQKNLISAATVGDVTVSSLRSSESTSDSKIVARKVGQFTANNKTFVLWVGTGDELASRVQNEITYFDKIVKTIKITTAAASVTISTADWKTYTNVAYGFSLKYPKEYTLTDTLPKTAEINTPKDVLKLKKGQIDVSFWPKPAGWGYEDYNKEISTEQIKVGGVSATERVLSNGSLAISVISTNDANPFFFWAPIGQQSDKVEFDQILSIFQFTK